MYYPTIAAEVLVSQDVEEDRFLPEGPREISFEGREALVWVNIQTGVDVTRGAVHMRFWDNGERRSLPQEARPGFLLPTNWDGLMVAGREKQIGLLDLRTNEWTPWATIPDSNPRTIINDGEVVPGGRAVVFGTKDLKFAEPLAHLYLFTLDDQKIWTLAEGQTCSNGKFFAEAAGKLFLFDIDTPKRNVVRNELNLAEHRIESSEIAIDLGKNEGFPDGMIVCDDPGGDMLRAIIAFYNPQPAEAGKAIMFDLKSGSALGEWTTAQSPRVTCPLLIERDGKVQLVLTTADEGMAAEIRTACPNAGNLFIAATDLPRLPRGEIIRF